MRAARIFLVATAPNGRITADVGWDTATILTTNVPRSSTETTPTATSDTASSAERRRRDGPRVGVVAAGMLVR